MYEQLSLFDCSDDVARGSIKDYTIDRIDTYQAKRYIRNHHYSKGSHNSPSPCYGLFYGLELIGVIMFANPCSEAVRSSVFGEDMKDCVIELHRLHILDGTPKNTESHFVASCLKLLHKDRPEIKAVISFSDMTEGHHGTIYRACSFYQCGQTDEATFYLDERGRLRHPRQNGKNITLEEARKRGWQPIRRKGKNRYIFLLPASKRERKELIKKCRYDLVKAHWEG